MLLSIAMLLFFVRPYNVEADQTSDTFTITATGEWIWLEINNASWAIGTVSMSQSYWTNATGAGDKEFHGEKSNCTVTTDFKLQVTSDAATWSAATDGNPPNTDTYRLNATCDDWSGEYQIVTASATTCDTSIAAATNVSFDLRFDAPTSTSTGDEQSLTVTGSLAKS
jgi:hypothetical protein